MDRLRLKLNEFFYHPEKRSFLVVNDVLAFFTLLSVFAIILETVESLRSYQVVFNYIEYITVALFTFEYIGRIIARKDKISYIFSFFGIIDLLAIIPTYLTLTNLTFLKTARVLRILRFLRMVRLAKLIRIETGQKKDMEEHAHLYRLNVRIYFFSLFSAVVVFGSLLYIFEGGQIGAANIPRGMIWAAKIITGGVAQHMPDTLFGDIVIIATRFTGLMLLGLLIFIVGDTVKKLLFGAPSDSKTLEGK